MVASKGARGRLDQERTRGVSVPASALRGSGFVASRSGLVAGVGSSMVRSSGSRSGSKKEWEPMLSLVWPLRRSSAPGPTMNLVGA